MKELEGAQERLSLHKVDLLDLNSVKSVVNGCDGVIHTASPVTDNPVSLSLSLSLTLYNIYQRKNLPKKMDAIIKMTTAITYGNIFFEYFHFWNSIIVS